MQTINASDVAVSYAYPSQWMASVPALGLIGYGHSQDEALANLALDAHFYGYRIA